MELPRKRVEIRAVGSSMIERIATAIAFAEGASIVTYDDQGRIFSVMRPLALPHTPELDNESVPNPTHDDEA